MPRFALPLVLLALASCAGGPRHPLAGPLHAVRSEPGYWISIDDGWLSVRVTSGEHGHRFQGSVSGIKGPLGPLQLERSGMAEQVAVDGDSVQFDLEPGKNAEEGFRVRVEHTCLRFDLYVNGAHHPERIHLGSHRLAPKGVPFERCP
jgi:hypothetical protein